jgi:hypothetical protein
LLFNLIQLTLNSRQGLKRKHRKGGGFGAQGAAERPEEATDRDHEPHGQRLRSCSGKPDGERASRGAQKINSLFCEFIKKIIVLLQNQNKETLCKVAAVF